MKRDRRPQRPAGGDVALLRRRCGLGYRARRGHWGGRGAARLGVGRGGVAGALDSPRTRPAATALRASPSGGPPSPRVRRCGGDWQRRGRGATAPCASGTGEITPAPAAAGRWRRGAPCSRCRRSGCHPGELGGRSGSARARSSSASASRRPLHKSTPVEISCGQLATPRRRRRVVDDRNPLPRILVGDERTSPRLGRCG